MATRLLDRNWPRRPPSKKSNPNYKKTNHITPVGEM